MKPCYSSYAALWDLIMRAGSNPFHYTVRQSMYEHIPEVRTIIPGLYLIGFGDEILLQGTGGYKLGANYAPGVVPQRTAAKHGYAQNLWLHGPDHELTEVHLFSV